MNKCSHHITKKPQFTNELPASIVKDETYVMVGKECPKNKSASYSRYCFLRTHVCEQCQEDADSKAVTK